MDKLPLDTKDEAKRILKPDGILIISTPKKALPLRNLFSRKPLNPYHVREYDKKNFEKILKNYCRVVKIYGQKKILKRSIAGMWRYLFYSLRGKLRGVEKENFDVIEFPKDGVHETA